MKGQLEIHGRHQAYVALAVVLSYAYARPVLAAADYGADVGLVTGYTSNLTLAPSGQEVSQWITSVAPRVFLTSVGGNYEFDLDYELQALIYPEDSKLNETFSELWTTGMLDLVRNQLFLAGFARATQVNIDPEAKLIDNNYNITGNRSNVFAWQVGPRWDRIWGTNFVEASFYVGEIQYDDENGQSVATQDGTFRLGTDMQYAGKLTYEVDYRYKNYDYELTGPFKDQRARLEAGYFTSAFFQLVGIAGIESNIVRNDGSLDEPYWEAGFRSWFGQNLLAAFYGQRFYGPTYRVEFERTMPQSRLRISYREIQQTDESAAIEDLATDQAADLDPMQDATLAPNSGLERPGTGDRSLTKRWRLDYRLFSYRSEFRIFGFITDREQISSLVTPVPPISPGGAVSSDESMGVGIDARWDIGVLTTVRFVGDWVNRKFDTQGLAGGRDSDLFRGDVELRYQLGAMTDLSARFGYQVQKNSAFDYDELHAGLEFRRYFAARR